MSQSASNLDSIVRPIDIILDGSNYSMCAQNIEVFLKGRRLWRYVTGDLATPNTEGKLIILENNYLPQILKLACAQDIQTFAAWLDRRKFMHFMMALCDDFESTRAFLLHRQPLITLDVTISKLISEETRRFTIKMQLSDMVLAAASRGPSPSSTVRSSSQSNSRNRLCRDAKLLRCSFLRLFQSHLTQSVDTHDPSTASEPIQGFTPSAYDSTLFLRTTGAGIILILLYVNYMIITGDDLFGIRDFQHFLSQNFEMKDLEQLNYFLGLEVTFGTRCKTCTSPLDPNVQLLAIDGESLPDATLYRQLIGSLIYLTVTRPDISYVVHLVSQFMSAPRSTHYAVVLRILRYVKGTLFHGLHFSSRSSLELRSYSDVDWAGDITDRRSTMGYCFLLDTSLISWRSKKQTVVARSSTEAEYRALANTTAKLLWLQ
ncbi:hypothetical protein F0562_010082 [Nyssa sinensis]|uniref:Reverse transcriptase Ty1/copia-type domain-containing protein n=1 Tax=Nyssa sinensis TaxID=561372 RepID=A0A5J5A021_9ASTE|nr:hypothetical protein F0562_010082 [Nyssa sinensis]